MRSRKRPGKLPLGHPASAHPIPIDVFGSAMQWRKLVCSMVVGRSLTAVTQHPLLSRFMSYNMTADGRLSLVRPHRWPY
jgi:hypothetical protein